VEEAVDDAVGSAAAGCSPLLLLGMRKMTSTAATRASTSAAEMMNAGLVKGFCSVVLCVDSLMLNLR
jgi:hypothetical protein